MIEVSHLTKYYGSFLAVDDLSFTIPDGHVYGFLGPNGAGKSTTMNIMTGCLSPTAGKIMIDGHDILAEPEAAMWGRPRVCGAARCMTKLKASWSGQRSQRWATVPSPPCPKATSSA